MAPTKLILGPLALLAMGTVWGLGFALAKIAGQNGAHPRGPDHLGDDRERNPAAAGLRRTRPLSAAAMGTSAQLFDQRITRLHHPGADPVLGSTASAGRSADLMIPMAPLLTYVLILGMKIERFDKFRALGVMAGFVGVVLIWVFSVSLDLLPSFG
ncbi:MAG: hypothetical protein HC824_14380, partial [Synechococcales cyanobacterium RM1_1_8]|nr:hypothetical protein [Synechococcales cyanobacterium RM1_1_8]